MHPNPAPVYHIVIAGGGTAGWMAANLLAQHFLAQPSDQAAAKFRISLVESPQIGIIGVGEGSTPSLKRFFQQMGIAETDWMAACHATYKTNIRFVDWSPAALTAAVTSKHRPVPSQHTQTAAGTQQYSHPFLTQLDTFSEQPFWQNCQLRRSGLDVTTAPELFLLNGWLANAGLAPVTPANFPFAIDYGYHFDSALLGQFLQRHAVGLGVNHLSAGIEAVERHPDGRIHRLICDQGRWLDGDFFLDCTGFSSLLLQQSLAVPFQSFNTNLFNDAAVVLPGPALATLPVETQATALTAGWCWQIPLTNRTGQGYVYSSTFLSAEQAEIELRQRLGLMDAPVAARHLSMKVGQVAQHWSENCLAIGLAQGFIEPLEATALHLVQTSVEMFIDYFAKGDYSNRYQADFNQHIHQRFERVRDYIVAHYKLNSRDDQGYWRANRDNMALSDSLLQLLDVWYRHGDLAAEIQRQQLASHFGTSSWHCLLAGYGIFPPLASPQPPLIDPWQQQRLAEFFRGCLLNFQPQQALLATRVCA